MKKKLLSLLLGLTLALSLVPSALALGSFADVTDAETAQNVEVLRLMGVLEGDNKGNFRPNDSLTRAEFTKMAVVLTGKKNVNVAYGNRNVGFLDMKSHWSSGYVNYAASKEVGLIRGLPDGTFRPNRAITYGEAMTILARLLGYNDADAGGVWPDGYLDLAAEAGMTRGISLAAGAAITRAQAAKLFVNALSSKNDKNETLFERLGYTQSKDETVLYGIDLANGKLRTEAGDMDLANVMTSTALNNLKGRVLTDAAGKAVTFLPSVSASSGGSAVSDAAIIVGADGSAAGFDALSGGATGYSVYRNGSLSAVAALRRNDVVTYNAEANAILACDTRVAVYYENCTPTPAAPDKIFVLGGTELRVLPTAQNSLAQYRPGQNMTLLLTADGKVAGTTTVSANACAYVGGDGKVSLLCGGSLRPLKLSGEGLTVDLSGALGTVSRISQSGGNAKSKATFTRQSGVTGDLDPVAQTLGTRKLADGALLFKGDKLTNLAALGRNVLPAARIAYAHANDADEIDLLFVKDMSGALYGKAVVTEVDTGKYKERRIAVSGPDGTSEALETGYRITDGVYIEAVLNADRTGYAGVYALTKLPNVPASAWIGEDLFNYGGATYLISEDVICYNRDSGTWFESLDAARTYGGTMEFYARDGMVHIVEVHS